MRTGLCSRRSSGSQPAGENQMGSSSTMITPDADVCWSMEEPFRCGWNLRTDPVVEMTCELSAAPCCYALSRRTWPVPSVRVAPVTA